MSLSSHLKGTDFLLCTLEREWGGGGRISTVAHFWADFPLLLPFDSPVPLSSPGEQTWGGFGLYSTRGRCSRNRLQCPSSWSPLTLRDLSHSVLCLCTKPETSSLTHTLRIGNLLSPYSPGLSWCSEGPRVLQSSLNRETVDHLLATKARADASASTVDRPGLHFSSRTDLGGSGSVGYEMEFWLGGVGAQQHTRDAGGHREIPLHLIPPPPNSGISPAPPDQPFPAPTREEPGRAKPQAGLPGWWPRELAPSARVPPGARASRAG